MEKTKKIWIGGHGRAGKDSMGLWLAEHTPLRFRGSTSVFLCPYVVHLKHDVPLDEVKAGKHQDLFAREFDSRHQNRRFWYNLGNLVRLTDPGFLVRDVLEGADIVCGCRDEAEVIYTRANRLVDVIVWVENPRVPKDPTMGYGPEWADVIIPNAGTIDEFYGKIREFCVDHGVPLIR